MESREIRVALLESESAQGKAERYVVDGVGFGGAGGRGCWDGDFQVG